MLNDSKTGKIALLFESRNNYQLFDEIFFKYTTVDFSNYYIFNIDLDSTPEQKELGKRICKKYNIVDLQVDPDDPHLYSAGRCFEICVDHIDKNNLDIDWVMWFQHDCHFIGDDFLQKLEEKINNNPRFIKEVGAIGFRDYNTVTVGSPIYGRGDLIEGIKNPPHGGWYENLPEEYSEAEYFVVECPQDNGVLFNKHLWKKHIKPDYNFRLFLWVPDVCAQFGLQGIASITIPSLEMADLYRLKPAFGVSRSTSGNLMFFTEDYNKKPWLKFWFEKYSWIKPHAREQFKAVEDKYKNSIQQKIFSWHILDGPKTLDDLKVS